MDYREFKRVLRLGEVLGSDYIDSKENVFIKSLLDMKHGDYIRKYYRLGDSYYNCYINNGDELFRVFENSGEIYISLPSFNIFDINYKQFYGHLSYNYGYLDYRQSFLLEYIRDYLL